MCRVHEALPDLTPSQHSSSDGEETPSPERVASTASELEEDMWPKIIQGRSWHVLPKIDITAPGPQVPAGPPKCNFSRWRSGGRERPSPALPGQDPRRVPSGSKLEGQKETTECRERPSWQVDKPPKLEPLTMCRVHWLSPEDNGRSINRANSFPPGKPISTSIKAASPLLPCPYTKVSLKMPLARSFQKASSGPELPLMDSNHLQDPSHLQIKTKLPESLQSGGLSPLTFVVHTIADLANGFILLEVAGGPEAGALAANIH
uniref:Uncharacterized protein n=1 Tax=Sphaerodactylus townsendi TaxID=933632 RepID=A0ACB8G0K4_9SAUR